MPVFLPLGISCSLLTLLTFYVKICEQLLYWTNKKRDVDPINKP